MTYIESLEDVGEARAFIAFLESEKRRHKRDIEVIKERILIVKDKFRYRGIEDDL